MNKENTMKCLETLYGTKCNHIDFSFGWTSENGMCQEGLVIKYAPPFVINKLVKDGYLLSLTQFGMIVEKY